jgi:hypothetical protein
MRLLFVISVIAAAIALCEAAPMLSGDYTSGPKKKHSSTHHETTDWQHVRGGWI